MDYSKPLSPVNQKWHEDPRIDARIRAFFSKYPFNVNADNETMIGLLNGDELGGGERLAPSSGLDISIREITSSPDNNVVKLSVMKPTGQQSLPCVVYIHGGGMSKYSCFYNNFQTFGRLISSQGIIVIMPDFRNSFAPSQPGEETKKFPGGLNDCVSTVKWVSEHQEELGINGNVFIAGESGGANLTIATALSLKNEGKLDIIRGFYAMCPYLAGKYPNEKFPSTTSNAGILLDYPLGGEPIIVRKYENEGDDLHGNKNCLAWPTYCTNDDIKGLPSSHFVVNEFDPLRDEGIEFYNRCQSLGLDTSLTILPGTIHGTGSYLVGLCPDISLSQAQSIHQFCVKHSK
uniref:Alpha/beta hydrolase fold-3 domain-containing protein n=1 Tax=Vannella robusta TaxID=1487602 RepID=A0A7S4IG55_9EUKA|mmetsp:Transcript_2538/g.3095  ORF Transcript_2538/g.3095 Transcript_2538/m.3095 type:complete len:347 (+) Transcript_2538:74-1114(+)